MRVVGVYAESPWKDLVIEMLGRANGLGTPDDAMNFICYLAVSACTTYGVSIDQFIGALRAYESFTKIVQDKQ